MRVLGLAAALVAAGLGVAAADTWPAAWTVVTDGQELRLELTVDGAGKVTGTLGQESVEGFLAGDRLVVTRPAADGMEIWSGLRGAGPDGAAFLAGTVDRDGELRPWYGVPDHGTASVDPASRTVVMQTEPPVPAEVSPAPVRTPLPIAAPSPPAAEERSEKPSTGGDLTLDGPWSTPTGTATIRQDGRRLEVVDAAGGVTDGRMTGETTFVVGLRVGCCRGELTGPGMIRWEDGTVWLRVDR